MDSDTQIDQIKHFLIIGNGGGGTSLLRGLLNAHNKINCLFENKGGKKAGDPQGSIDEWLKLSNENDSYIWGNKIPIEQFISMNWKDEHIYKLTDIFKIVWLTRRFSRYFKKSFGTYEKYRRTWTWTRKL